ncbi:MAG: hypothetical protein ACI4EI_09260 [Muricoprocola sp.]
MKRGRWVAAVLVSGCLLTGCSSFSPEVTGISINKKGGISEVVRESFDASYYSEAELEQEIDTAIGLYTSENGSKTVKKKSLSVKNGEAVLKMEYASDKDYAEFNNVGFYLGNISGAIQAGYPFDGSFYQVVLGKIDDSNTVWGSSIMSGTNYKTVVVSEPLLVEVPGTIHYVSENVKVRDKSTAVTESTEVAYILYE